MEANEIKAALDGIKSQVETKTTEQATEIKGLITALEEKMKAENNTAIEGLKADLKAIQDHADKLDVKMQEKGAGEAKSESYNEVMVKSIAENFETIRTVTKGKSAKMEVKTVGNMTAATNLTGSVVNTYQQGVAMVPSQMINFADLVPTVNSATGSYVIYRETGTEGSISVQGTHGAPKTQIDYDYTAVTFTADYISGYARVAKQMIQDLPFLQSSLPNQLRRDYFKAENAKFVTDLLAAATVSTTAKTVDVEQLIDDIANLEAIDYMVNGIVLNPADWASIAMTKPNDYSLPGIVQFVNGNLTINGIPVYKASWLAKDTYLVGDWTYAKKVVVDGLAVEFFEQDSDNVQRNLITARVESRTVLAIDRPNAFIKGDFGNVVGSL